MSVLPAFFLLLVVTAYGLLALVLLGHLLRDLLTRVRDARIRMLATARRTQREIPKQFVNRRTSHANSH
ncbi:MAG TPA: hypothetical protein VE977_17230 [Pyrinomonadaceae bacterium]|nr:hypothetical protein [Pyrinomonadaceae bacterium]